VAVYVGFSSTLVTAQCCKHPGLRAKPSADFGTSTSAPVDTTLKDLVTVGKVVVNFADDFRADVVRLDGMALKYSDEDETMKYSSSGSKRLADRFVLRPPGQKQPAMIH